MRKVHKMLMKNHFQLKEGAEKSKKCEILFSFLIYFVEGDFINIIIITGIIMFYLPF